MLYAHLYLFVVYILFAPVISTSIHCCVYNSHDIKVLMKVIETEMFNVGFTSQQIHLFGLFCFSAFLIPPDLDPYLLSYINDIYINEDVVPVEVM